MKQAMRIRLWHIHKSRIRNPNKIKAALSQAAAMQARFDSNCVKIPVRKWREEKAVAAPVDFVTTNAPEETAVRGGPIQANRSLRFATLPPELLDLPGNKKEKQLAVLLLKGYDFSEAARLVGLPVRTASWRLRRLYTLAGWVQN